MVRLVVGDDNIRNESLKARPHKLMLIMLNFINAILNSGIVPHTTWCWSNDASLQKYSHFDPDDYI